MTILFSTMLFCCGVLACDVWCTILLLTNKLVMKNSVSLSPLIIFIVVSNCVWTKTTKIFKVLTTSDFYFKRKNHVYLKWPWIDGIEYGLIHLHESIQNIFRFRCTNRKGKSFLFCKMTNITNNRFFIFNKMKLSHDNINTFVWNMP